MDLPIPAGHNTVNPYFTVRDARDALDFLTTVFGATIADLTVGDDNAVYHAEARVGNSTVMFSEATDSAPLVLGSAYVYVPDVDSAYHRALERGATGLQAPEDPFFGVRSAGVRDTQGIVWWMNTPIAGAADPPTPN
ncbi:MAG: VOC family protein [Dehalococcoidia bacterium]|nr:VOC family protein [Dehalococcoidia bacterium]